MTRDRYSGISLALLRDYRSVLLSDAERRTECSAKVAAIPGLGGIVDNRTKALNRSLARLMRRRGTRAAALLPSRAGRDRSGAE